MYVFIPPSVMQLLSLKVNWKCSAPSVQGGGRDVPLGALSFILFLPDLLKGTEVGIGLLLCASSVLHVPGTCLASELSPEPF